DDSGTAPAGCDYGSEYSREEINAAVIGGGDAQGKDLWGHGTHVAGIAAGSGRASGNGRPAGTYVGVAPDAELIIVKSGNEEFLSSYIMDGVDYIFSKAQDYDASRPVVVNLSVGTHLGPHDGTSLFERFIDQELNGQGRAVVVASGNEGNRAVHAEAYLAPGSGPDTVQVGIAVPQNEPGRRDAVRLDIWASRHSDVEVSVRTPANEILGPVTAGDIREWESAEGHVYVDNASGGMYPINGDVEILVDLEDAAGDGGHSDNLSAGVWRLEFRGSAGRLDAWIYQSDFSDAAFTSHASYSTLVAEPGNAVYAITVGSYVTRVSWPSLLADPWGPGGLEGGRLSASSSPGPTRPGDFFPDTRRKPEIAAPGEYIVSALSVFKTNPVSGYMTASDSVHHAWNGTSMAAPHVTGLAALLLESNPGLDPVDIQNTIISTAKQDGFTGDIWNPLWGFGKCDGLGAMRKTSIGESDGATQPGPYRTAWNFPNPFNSVTVLSVRFPDRRPGMPAPAHMVILDLRGRRIRALPVSCTGDGLCRAVWDAKDDKGFPVPSGIYFFRLRAHGAPVAGKMVLAR
ncbi:S8 family serine peptidase, partial [bacterium]|nr:S8 family serine peptidase [bacterium]